MIYKCKIKEECRQKKRGRGYLDLNNGVRYMESAHHPANTRRQHNVDLILGYRLIRWLNNKPALGRDQLTQCWFNVEPSSLTMAQH